MKAFLLDSIFWTFFFLILTHIIVIMYNHILSAACSGSCSLLFKGLIILD